MYCIRICNPCWPTLVSFARPYLHAAMILSLSATTMAQALVLLLAAASSAHAVDPVAQACKLASGRLSASCGPYGNLTCPTNKKKGGFCGTGLAHCRANECCDQYGICGTGKAACNAVCQCELSGKNSGCNGRLIPDPILPIVDLASVCGTHIGKCPDGYCCSGYGFCTNNETVCNGNGEYHPSCSNGGPLVRPPSSLLLRTDPRDLSTYSSTALLHLQPNARSPLLVYLFIHCCTYR